jgi:hypothetical protein
MIYDPPSINGIQKTLDAQLLSGITASMTLNNVTGIQDKPGVCVVDLIDANEKFTPTKREYISFTGVSGNTLTGLTRNADSGGSDQDHAVGAIVQFPADVLQQQALIDLIRVQHNDDGTHKSALVTTLKATGSVVNTGTSDDTIVTPKAVKDAGLPYTGKASGAEVNTGTEDVKYVTPKAIADSDYAKTTDIADSTTTFTNKRINPRIVTAASYTTNTGTALDVSTCDEFDVTAQAGALKLNNPGGTPVNGQKLIVRIKDNGSPRALTYDTQFRASSDLALPTTTVLGKTLYMGFVYNSADSKWDLLAYLDNI